MPFEEARKYINPPPKKKQRRVRRNCPKVTPWTPPKRISKKARNGGRCDYLTPDGTHCSHWQAPKSLACWCHREAYEGR